MSKKFLLVYLLLFSSMAFTSTSAMAQRTMSGQFMAEGLGLWCGTGAGGQVSFGQYLQSSMWRSQICMRNYSTSLSTGDRMAYTDMVAQGRWDYRIISTRSRMLSLYAGAGLFLGYEAYDISGRLPDNVDTGLGQGSFLYGITAGLSTEVFFVRRVALVIGADIPINFSSPVEKFHWEVSAGIRINL